MQTSFNPVQYKEQLRTYFDGVGFERWSAIYGDDDNLSAIRRSIREGHNMMMAQVDAWLNAHNLPAGSSVLDAGCGTGLVSLALARRGYHVTSVDIAPQMVRKTREHAIQAGLDGQMRFVAGDLEVIGGTYDAVVCLDVLIHYPRPGFTEMCTRLANRAQGPLIITYAPYNRILAMKHWIGGLFPKSQRRTTIQMIPDNLVKKTLESAGMQINDTQRISHGFYHVAMLEAYPR